MTEAELSKLIRDANKAYYHNNELIITDNEYDILIEHTKLRYPNNEAVKEGHTKSLNTEDESVEKNKVKLPYQMWSMDKIKPDTNALSKWIKKYKGPYMLSCKVDGVSGLYTTEGHEPKLYTRGDGTTGQDVSHIIPYLKLPTMKNITVRGEFIISKELFATKYASKFANPRNFVAGLINKKTINEDIYKDISFVIYEIISPVLKPSEQMKFINDINTDINTDINKTTSTHTNSINLEVVKYSIISTISNELLSELLIQWREEYKYEIDGIICMNDEIYSRPTGNPEYAFAFKMVLSDQVAEAKVVDVIWTASKDGYLKPRVKIEPITLGGVTIEYATGFNAKFIEDNKIGLGSLIRIIRSGDVIPHIIATIQPASSPLFPSEPYEWNETHVDFIVKNKADNHIVKEKNITYFFTNIGVEGLSSGNVKRIVEAGYDTLQKIIAMTEDDLLKVEGFKKKMAAKISIGIKDRLKEASLPELMHATNIFGRGFGTKKLELILNKFPTILLDNANANANKQDKIKMISKIQGMAKKTAEQFVDKIDEFIGLMNEINLNDKLNYVPKKTDTLSQSHPLYKKKYVMTGFRDKELIAKLDAIGAEQASSVSKNTFLLIVKNMDEDTGKAEEARKLNIPIMTPEMVQQNYF
jgi:NAD-dependent DNA ligase